MASFTFDTNFNEKGPVITPRKYRELKHQPNKDYSEDDYETPDLDFVYDDADTHANEIAELYSYTEKHELMYNLKAFEEQMEQYKLQPWWQTHPTSQQRSIIYKLLDQLEVSNKQIRMKAACAILYLAQGSWAEVQSDKEQQDWTRTNVMLLYEAGVFPAFVELLNIEIDAAATSASRKLAVSLADSVDLRVILSVLYIITEVMRVEALDIEKSPYKKNVEAFKEELINPYGEELLAVKLLGMATRFCSGSASHFPMKKVLLLLWKVILVSLGGIETLRELKANYRAEAGLDIQEEDTIEIAKGMRSCSPPASAADLLETQNQKRSGRSFRRMLMKQSSLDEPELVIDLDGARGNSGLTGNEGDREMNEYEEQQGFEDQFQFSTPQHNQTESRSSTPESTKAKVGLPWIPKVRQKDVDTFLAVSRMKFVGYKLQGDRESLAGLPQPIHEGVNILKKHMYTSLAEIQIQKEEEMARNPMSTPEPMPRQTPTEILYQAILANLPQYKIALLKILLAAAPTSKAKTDTINIVADVLPEEMPITVLQSMKLGIDVSRHKEIIVKAVSAILLLLLKHFKLNHVYQFEFMSQHLVFANCIPLVLKFLNQNVMTYIEAENFIPILDFPSCVIGDQPELTAETLEIGDGKPYCWRNIFSCINLLRILNKLTKWKHSRIMMLVVFKSAPILKRTLKVRHGMMQLYVLKLLKMQTKYLGRQWRKSNMKTISAIYGKVRHRLNDDWAYGNDLEARPWDFQEEECALRACVDRFNNRRYTNNVRDKEMEPMDTFVTSVLGSDVELTEEFKQHYELWLQQEVFQASINWDELLQSSNYEV
ncbi:striatin-interacting protein 1 isoform X2 [Neodiprion virginianus]|uniref:striatin-interacting protein 1 isoform X2 n=1 Tax=Neodiprion virginianus TaxID=2961670 RepID=UPI001EDD6014|nr:striatin-interacting protein 1 isoform X2 [Neodiprion pinetum]XP_046621758.1 striatin-interacting protein 1 isoform X2 [Neodiprion virginianus]